MNRRRFYILVLVLILAAAATVVGYRQTRSANNPGTTDPTPSLTPAEPEPPDDGEWNTYHGGPTLQGVADAALPDSLDILWRFKAGVAVTQPPVVHEGRIFFSTEHAEVYALDFRGQRLWSHEFVSQEQRDGKPVREYIDAPLASFGGIVLAGLASGMLHALDAVSGQEKWKTQIDGPVLGTPNLLTLSEKDFIIVIGKSRGILHCLDASTGQVVWRGEPTDRCDGSPSIAPNAVIFGSCAAALHVFASDTGKLIKNIPVDEDSQIAGGIAVDGNAAFSGCRSGKILQFDLKAGNILWANPESESEVFSTPAVTADTVVAFSEDRKVYALDRATGKTRWKFDSKGMPSSPVIAGEKVLVCADGQLFLLRLTDGAEIWSIKLADDITSPALTKRMVILGTGDGTVIALGKSTQPKGTGIQ